MQHSNDIRYFLYARKSTEAEDRQVQSIDDQLTRLRGIAAVRGLLVVREYTEAKSARKPHARPGFAAMLAAIRGGEADGILCWQLNRLSRNPLDSGELAWMLQNGTLRSIVTSEREHRPEDNVLLFSVETGMANQFVLELSRNVRRGIQGKIERGGLPGRAPVGYLNDRGAKCVLPDPERFDTIRQLWSLMLTGNYTVAQLARKLNDEWAFRTIRRSRTGGTPLALSALYRVFSNPFYAGIISVNGKRYAGKHRPMITLDEFSAVQEIMGKADRPRPSKHIFTYSRLFTCAECGCFITAEVRSKKLKSTGHQASYTYYHCTHRKRDVRCSQREYVPEAALTQRIADLLVPLSIPSSWLDYSLRVLLRGVGMDATVADQRLSVLNAEIEEVEREKGRLTQMRYRELIGDAEFIEQRKPLDDRIAAARVQIGDTAAVDPDHRRAQIESAFRALVDLAEAFARRGMEWRRNLLVLIGANRVLHDANPLISLKEWVRPIADQRKAWLAEYRRFELMKEADLPTQKDAFASLFPVWSGIVDEVGTRLAVIHNEWSDSQGNRGAAGISFPFSPGKALVSTRGSVVQSGNSFPPLSSKGSLWLGIVPTPAVPETKLSWRARLKRFFSRSKDTTGDHFEKAA